ncbi:MAG: RNA methyltransferase, partial [Spirochaetales bacterium]|nr:RNA methyltransferase [Spirochaetales bacterium]
SQAVQIICYSLFQRLRPYAGEINTVTSERVNAAVSSCIADLEAIGYFKNNDEKDFTGEFLSSIMQRAGMTEGEVQRMEKIFSKTHKIAQHKEKNK